MYLWKILKFHISICSIFRALIRSKKYIINEQMFLNTHNVFYPQYSPHHVSEQRIRNAEKEIFFTIACRWNGEWYCIRDFGYPRHAMWLATLMHGVYDGYLTQKMVGNWSEWLLCSVKNTEFLCFEVLNMRIIKSELMAAIYIR